MRYIGQMTLQKQMRQDVRVRAAVKILFTGELDENRCFPEDQISVGILADISRGGCFVLTRDKIIYKGKLIFLYLYVKNEQDEIVMNTIVPGRVVVVKSIGNDKSMKCQGMAVNFLNMSKQTEDKLVNWIFEEQRKQLAERRS